MFVCRTFSLKFSVVLECEQYIKPPKANERKPCVADHIVRLRYAENVIVTERTRLPRREYSR